MIVEDFSNMARRNVEGCPSPSGTQMAGMLVRVRPNVVLTIEAHEVLLLMGRLTVDGDVVLLGDAVGIY